MSGLAECVVEGCENPRRSSLKDICEMHYYRMRRTGRYDLATAKERAQARPAPKACEVSGCERIACRRCTDAHVCQLHAKRWIRNGTFDAIRVVAPPREKRGVCSIDGCEAVDDGPHGLCKRHKTRERRHGDPLAFIAPSDRNVQRGETHHAWTGQDGTYAAAHQRLKVSLGPASTYPCVDCGSTAAQWSYNRDDPDEKQDAKGPYSLKADHYRPRCVSCHKRFDLAHIRGAA